jgi:hypothetical protein
MERYIGIVQINKKIETGITIDFKYRDFYSDEKRIMRKWFSLYPKCKTQDLEVKHVILPYTKDLEEMFGIYRDFTPLTKEEKEKEVRIAKRKELLLHNEELYKQVYDGTITLDEAYNQHMANKRVRERKETN